jgi:predicted ATPase
MAYLAQWGEQARLLVIGSYRPADMVLSDLPLRRVVQSLIGRRQSQELALELFTQAEVGAYLSQRLARSPVVEGLGPVIHRRTEGNALFVMHFVDYLLQRGSLVEAALTAAEVLVVDADPSVIPDDVPSCLSS